MEPNHEWRLDWRWLGSVGVVGWTWVEGMGVGTMAAGLLFLIGEEGSGESSWERERVLEEQGEGLGVVKEGWAEVSGGRVAADAIF